MKINDRSLHYFYGGSHASEHPINALVLQIVAQPGLLGKLGNRTVVPSTNSGSHGVRSYEAAKQRNGTKSFMYVIVGIAKQVYCLNNVCTNAHVLTCKRIF